MAIPGYNPKQNYSTAIPDGAYRIIFDSAKFEPTKDGQGTKLNLHWQVVEGECKGRGTFESLNVVNRSEDCVNIAMGQLNRYYKAVGKEDTDDENELLNVPFCVKVKNTTSKCGNWDNVNITPIPESKMSQEEEDMIPF
jgi:hypothetical protein